MTVLWFVGLVIIWLAAAIVFTYCGVMLIKDAGKWVEHRLEILDAKSLSYPIPSGEYYILPKNNEQDKGYCCYGSNNEGINNQSKSSVILSPYDILTLKENTYCQNDESYNKGEIVFLACCHILSCLFHASKVIISKHQLNANNTKANTH